ncbi:conserved hypothetical protein [Arthrobacter sp. Hiyo4]|nr:conserved hypothetical protein [Arthrobacter sp. Hiyo4]
MTKSQNPVVLTQASIEAGSEEVVDANVHVVNAMYGKLLDAGEIAPAALGSYYVDFYVTQSLEGGFAQYVFTADRDEVDPLIREGLAGMGATAHLELFNRTVAVFDALSEEDEERYLDGDLDTEEESNDAVRTIEELDGEFEELFETENITALNAAWLLRQEGLLVLDEDELEAYIERQVALIPNLEERQAAADEEALEDARTSRSSSVNCAASPATRSRRSPWATPTTCMTARRRWPGTSPRTTATSSWWRTTKRRS